VVDGPGVYTAGMHNTVTNRTKMWFDNLGGVKSSAIFQTTATVAMAIGGIAFFVTGVVTGEAANLQPLFTDGAGLTAVILAVPAMFVGFDVIPQAAEEMDIDALDCLWTELSSYDFAEDKQETLEKIQKAILAFDVDYLQGVTHL